MATHAVGGIGSNDERTGLLEPHQATQERRVVRQHLTLGNRAQRTVESRHALDEHVLDGLQTGLLAYRHGASAAELNAVVLGRIVGGGEHRARVVQGTCREVQLVGGRKIQLDDVEALGDDALSKSLGQRRRGRAHVVADGDGGLTLAAQDGRVRRTRVPNEVFVDILAHDATHVISLNHCIELFTSSHKPQV